MILAFSGGTSGFGGSLFAVEEGLDVVIRVEKVGVPTQPKHRIYAAIEKSVSRCGFHSAGFDRHYPVQISIECRFEYRHPQPGRGRIRGIPNFDRQRILGGISRLAQQFFGFLDVTVAVAGLKCGLVGIEGGRQQAVEGFGFSVKDPFVEEVAIDRSGNGLSDFKAIEGGLAHVHHQIRNHRTLGLKHLPPFLQCQFFEAVNLVGIQGLVSDIHRLGAEGIV